MLLRIFTEPQQGATYDDLLRVALAAERLGYGAFFRSDHYLKMGDVSGLPGPTDAWLTLAGLASADGSLALPERMAPINALLDVAPPALREGMLLAFLDRLSRPS